ncbi:Salicylate carboxymethyltransferase, partial [Cucurbita argyrosperma subsp. sororia]
MGGSVDDEKEVCMAVGVGDGSYAKNSLLQAISTAWPIIKEAIQDLCTQNIPTTFNIADLGLFPDKTLHFVHSSYCLQWLSQVPEGMEIENKGNIFIDSTSPENVIEAYHRQFQKDFSLFLKCRAEEVVVGGRMVHTIIGRTDGYPSNKDYCYALQLLNLALNKMVAEGMVEEEKMDRFNIPNFMPSPQEIKDEIQKEGSFMIKRLEVSRIDWNFYNIDSTSVDVGVDSSYNIAKCIRSVMEPLMIPHFGEAIMEQLFDRSWGPQLCQKLLTSDLGCASGPNTLMIVSNLIKQLHHFYQNLPNQSLNYQIFFNDLPANDFNAIFRSLPGLLDNLKAQIGGDFGPCFFYGVPGSFYGRLFPDKTLHFVHSSYSLHWLSQGMVEKEKMDRFNIPNFMPTPQEIKEEIQKEGSFMIKRLEMSRIDWNFYNIDASSVGVGVDSSYNIAKCIRSVMEPLMIPHFGEAIMEQLFDSYRKIVKDEMANKKIEFINLTVSLIRI